MKQFRSVSIVVLCALFAFSSSGLAMSSKKVSGGSRDIASDRDVASEEHEKKNVPQMISYDELMNLSSEERNDYLYGVRELLVQLSHGRDKASDLFVDGQTYDQYQRIIDLLMPKADAQWVNPDRTRRRAGQVVPRLISTTGFGENWECPNSGNTHKFNYDVGTCVRGSDFNCPTNLSGDHVRVNVRNKNNVTQYCVPAASYNNLDVKRRRQLRSADGAPSIANVFGNTNRTGSEKNGAEVVFGNAQRTKTSARALVYPTVSEFSSSGTPMCNSVDKSIRYNEEVGTCSGGEVKLTQDCDKGFAKVRIVSNSTSGIPLFNRKTTTNQKFYCVPPGSWCHLPESRRTALQYDPNEASLTPNAATAGDRRSALKEITKLTPEQARHIASNCAREQGVKPADVTTPRLSGRSSLASSSPSTAPTEETEQIVSGGAECTEPRFSAESCATKEERESLRSKNEKWYRENVNTCIFAGNVSDYREGVNTAKACKPVYSMKNLSCKTGVLCSPIVFGVKADGGAYCAVNNDGEATLECDALATAGPSNDNWLNENIGNLRSQYEGLRNGINNLCGRSASRNFYCDECNKILSRLNNLQLVGQLGNQCVIGKVKSQEEATSKPSAPPKAPTEAVQ